MYTEQQRLRTAIPALRYDGSLAFADWQRAAREELRGLLGMDRLTAVEPLVAVESDTDKPDYREIRFTFRSEEDYFVPCHLLVPHTDHAKLPLMVCLQGHSTGMHISLGRPKHPGDESSIGEGDRDFALQAVSRGYAAVTLEQRCFGECGGTPKPDCRHASMLALLTGRTMIGERVWDVQRLLDVLPGIYTQIDKDRMYCMGNSGGGTTTVYLACLEERLAGFMPSCSFSTFAASLGDHSHCACNFVPGIANRFDMGDLLGLAAPRPLVVVSGQHDDIFPIEDAKAMFALVRSLYAQCGARARCAHVVGEAGHRFYADEGWRTFERIVSGEQGAAE